SDAYAVFPNIDVQNGRYLVGWENGDDAVQYMQGDSNGTQGEVSTIENNGYARVLWEPDGEAHVYSHQRSPLELQRDGRSISGLGNTLFANAARGDGTVLFAYYRLQSGYKNDVYYGSIDVDGEQTADILLASDPPAAPYRPAVTHVFDNMYFVAWSQGENPDFALWGQFVTVE
ncbi:MAG: hypothetical protein VX278_03780, partial [Myxococcota bacterium]|nr:hypothetical protein [Myxococcota bacterium]